MRLSVLLGEQGLQPRESQGVSSFLSKAAELQPQVVVQAGRHLRVLFRGVTSSDHTVDRPLVGVCALSYTAAVLKANCSLCLGRKALVRCCGQLLQQRLGIGRDIYLSFSCLFQDN